jgi:hypothetical protein
MFTPVPDFVQAIAVNEVIYSFFSHFSQTSEYRGVNVAVVNVTDCYPEGAGKCSIWIFFLMKMC